MMIIANPGNILSQEGQTLLMNAFETQRFNNEAMETFNEWIINIFTGVGLVHKVEDTEDGTILGIDLDPGKDTDGSFPGISLN